VTSPQFSVIIPTYGRPQQLNACLRSVLQLQFPRDRFEVIVVDDGSPDPPESVVATYRDHLQLRLLTQNHAGPATARNTGAAEAHGAFLAFIDDDCLPASDWLQKLEASFTRNPAGAVGGRTENGLPENLYSAASQTLIDYLYSYFNSNSDRAHFFASNNLAFPAEPFRAIGGFEPTFPKAAGEDRELCDRWLYHGFPMIYDTEVVVFHNHPLTFRRFCRQHFNYGRGAFFFHQLRAKRMQAPIRMEPVSFYWNLLKHPFSNQNLSSPFLVSMLLLITQAANASGFYWEKMQGGKK